MGTVRMRPLTGEDLSTLSVGDTVYRRRDHGGSTTFDQAEVVGLRGKDVRARGTDAREVVGQQVHVAVRSIYGSETTHPMFTTQEAFDARYPSSDMLRAGDPYAGEHDRTREGMLANVAEGSLRLAVGDDDPDGEEQPVTPTYGAQVTLTVFVPDMDADEAQQRVVNHLIPLTNARAHIPNLRSRPVADRRVNVYAMRDEAPLAYNVLEAESGYYAPGNCLIENVDPAVPTGPPTSAGSPR